MSSNDARSFHSPASPSSNPCSETALMNQRSFDHRFSPSSKKITLKTPTGQLIDLEKYRDETKATTTPPSTRQETEMAWRKRLEKEWHGMGMVSKAKKSGRKARGEALSRRPNHKDEESTKHGFELGNTPTNEEVAFTAPQMAIEMFTGNRRLNPHAKPFLPQNPAVVDATPTDGS